MDESLFSPGDWVVWLPFEGCSAKDVEVGRVKSLSEGNPDLVFVVYHCGGDWENYQNYTGAGTSVRWLLPMRDWQVLTDLGLM